MLPTWSWKKYSFSYPLSWWTTMPSKLAGDHFLLGVAACMIMKMMLHLETGFDICEGNLRRWSCHDWKLLNNHHIQSAIFSSAVYIRIAIIERNMYTGACVPVVCSRCSVISVYAIKPSCSLSEFHCIRNCFDIAYSIIILDWNFPFLLSWKLNLGKQKQISLYRRITLIL